MRDRLTFIIATSLACGSLATMAMPGAALTGVRPSVPAFRLVAQAEGEAEASGEGASDTPTPAATGEASDPGADAGESAEEPSLTVGDSGPEVRELQMRLERLEIYTGEITGEYDEATEAAVREFQQQNDLEATGTFNIDTWRELEAAQNPGQRQNSGLFRLTPKRILALVVGGGLVLVVGGVGGMMLLLRAINRSPEPAATESELEAEGGQAAAAYFEASEPALADSALENFSGAGLNDPQGMKTSMPPVRSTAVPPSWPERAPSPAAETKFIPSAAPHFESASSEPEAPLVPSADLPPEPVAPPPESAPASAVVADTHHHKPIAAPSLNRPGQNGADAVGEPLLPVRSPAFVNLDRVDKLIRELRDPDADRRQQAIWELAQQADSRAVQPLVNLLLDSDSQQQSLILEALSQIGTRALKPMNRALALSLQDDDAQVRRNAIRDLTRIYELVAQLSQLIYYATDDPDPDVQETARWALGQLNNIRVSSNIAQNSGRTPSS